MRSLRLSSPLLALAALPACTYDATACQPTRTTANAATKVDLTAPLSSATISAKLTAGERALDGMRLTFEVMDDGGTVYEAAATTGGDGVAKVDLKRADPEALVALARADRFRATFAGDSEYCRSSDDAAFGTVRT